MKATTENIYARSKLSEAVRLLAVGEEDVRHRIGWAAKELVILRPEDLPEPFRKQLSLILEHCSARGTLLASDGTTALGAIQNTVLRLRKKTASNIAQQIYNLFHEVDHYVQNSE